jgi:phospholipid transport system transporter-binding protein
MSARLVAEGAGRWRIEGAMRFDGVPALLAQRPEVAGGDATLDVSTVTDFDSSALALLLEWRRRALAAGGRLRIENLPGRLRNLARLGGVEAMLRD